MSGSADIHVKDAGVYLCAHGGAEDNWIIRVLHAALARHECWEDATWLTAIIFREMIRNEDTAFGSLGIADGAPDEALRITVDCKKKEVCMQEFPGAELMADKMVKALASRVGKEEAEEPFKDIVQKSKQLRIYTFEEFVAADIEKLGYYL